jgi:hypothetical protein
MFCTYIHGCYLYLSDTVDGIKKKGGGGVLRSKEILLEVWKPVREPYSKAGSSVLSFSCVQVLNNGRINYIEMWWCLNVPECLLTTTQVLLQYAGCPAVNDIMMMELASRQSIYLL